MDSLLVEHEKLLIEKVIQLLASTPEQFTAISGNGIDSTVASWNRNIVIMIETGQIIIPTRPDMTQKQKDVVKELLRPIVVRDSKILIEKLVG